MVHVGVTGYLQSLNACRHNCIHTVHVVMISSHRFCWRCDGYISIRPVIREDGLGMVCAASRREDGLGSTCIDLLPESIGAADSRSDDLVGGRVGTKSVVYGGGPSPPIVQSSVLAMELMPVLQEVTPETLS